MIRHGLIRILVILLILLISFLCYADDYFWIGGSGNWSDINHWSASSGGTVLHNTPPSATDDVYFDENSFTGPNQTVSVDAENAVCKNLDCTGAQHLPTFTNSSSINLRIFRSLTLITDMNYDYNGTITFESTETGNTILSSGQELKNKVFFEGTGGEWTLIDNFTVNDKIYLNTGSLITNNQTINCSGFYSNTSNNRKLYLENSTININGSCSINGTNLVFNAGNSIFNISGYLLNTNGDVLNYNKVIFTGFLSNIQNINVYVYYDTLLFQQTGNVYGDCYINYLSFELSGGVYDSDTIKYVKFGNMGTSVLNGNHIVDTAKFLNSAQIKGQNNIHYSLIKGKAFIENNNEIDYITIGDTAFIKDSNTFGYLFLNRMVYFRGSNNAKNAYLNCDGDFGGNQTFDTLTLTPGFSYVFEHDSTQTINNEFNLNGTCESPIFLKSSYNGLQATIHKTNGTVNGTHLSIRDINASGSVPFYAIQSVNLGNNTNWDIDEVTSRDLYWVNGQGNWNESQHWDISNGGSGGHCPPTERDNVFINGSSFASAGDSVLINTRNAVCHDMDWTGANNPIFAGPDTNYLKIYGSLTFIENMNFSFTGETHFEATTTGKTIASAQNQFNNNVRFQGINGGWTLLDKFVCSDTIFHEHGWLSTDGSNIESQFFFVIDTNYRELLLHTDTVKLNGQDTVWYVDGTNLTLHADSSVIITYGSYAIMQSKNAERLIYHNIHQNGVVAQVKNDAYCVYNLVTHLGPSSFITGDCTIDTAIFYSSGGAIYSSDTIKTAIFYGTNGALSGSHIVEIAYYYEDGTASGNNKIDTALFYAKGSIIGTNQIDTTIIYDDALISVENIIRTATLKDNGDFYGNNTFNDLSLSYVKKYLFEHDSTQTIIDNFNANGRCTGNIILMSDFDGKQAIIEKVNGSVEIEYANIRDLKATGSIPFIANSSIDLGNNENWEITMAQSLALYWVDGTGNWSDSLHWAPVSGGQGGYCIPSPIDDVYFDDSSFYSQTQTVTIDIENATCRNMDWSGSEPFNPVFSGSNQNGMYIYGSLKLNDSLNLNYQGITYFESTEEGRTIDSKDKSFDNNVIFRGRGGGWYFNDNFSTDNDFYFVHGKLNSNGYDISCYNFYSTDTNFRTITLDTSHIYSSNRWVINTYKLDIDADSCLINTGSLLKTYYDDTLGKNNYKDTVRYNDILITGNQGAILNDSVYCYFDDIHFLGVGSVSGDCDIDTVIIEGSGTINDSDSINFAHFKLYGSLNGGEHYVKSAIFDGPGNISGSNKVLSAIFNSSGDISGNNVIDTTIIYGNGYIDGNNMFNSSINIYGTGYINGNNIFNSSVYIYGTGNISGENQMQSDLIIHGYAFIFGSNQIHDALLLDWGEMGGENMFDILTFTPGNTYELHPFTTQYINEEFNIRGNNCFPITFRSKSDQQQASVFKPSGTVSGDFIEMSRIIATGDALFYAGGHSTDEGLNQNWIWDNAPGYIFGLCNDTTICEGDTLILTTENFNADSNAVFKWDDGSISPTYMVTDSGMYRVIVYYSVIPDTCAVPDSIYVSLLPAPEVDLGNDTIICEGETVELTSTGDYENYLWNDGSTGSSINATMSGLCWVEVWDENGCSNRDSIVLTVLPAPDVFLGNDTIIHNDEFILLNAGYPGGIYEWSTGDTTQAIEAGGVEGGLEYRVDVIYGGCLGSDTIVIDEYPYCIADVPTAFSPNGDGINDVLYVRGSGIAILDFKVFDRYGKLVFETDNPTKGWDGKVDDFKQETEVYVYYLKAICFDGVLIEKKGNVTLLK